MIHHRILMMAGIAALAAPGFAHADDAAPQVDINGTVGEACGMGSPQAAVIDLHDLTGPNGALKASLLSDAVSGSTVIDDAWCNAPHTLTLQATKMTLVTPPTHNQPDYMSRELIYRATLRNWAPGQSIGVRINGGNDTTEAGFDAARAAQTPGLTLEISKLGALSKAGGEDNTLMLETAGDGTYRGLVTITLATNP